MSCTPTSNPVPITINPGTHLHVSCTAYAAFYQQVILSFNQNMTNPIGTFVGTGENVVMLANGQALIKIPTGTNTKLYAKFNYSTNGSSGPFQLGSVCPPLVRGNYPDVVVTTATSEDSTDNDDNDSYLFVVQVAPSSTV